MIGWENLKIFLRKQNDVQNDPYGMDYYEKKAKDFIRKYTKHDEHSVDKG